MNCTTPETVDASGDIVGPGVLVAFFGSTVVTILSVLWAYITESLDDDLLNDLDRRILAQATQSLRRFRPCEQQEVATTGSTRNIHPGETRQLRKRTITKFVLALSDQQLLTGLAILIAGISSQSYISGYELQVVVSLAWFSSTAHLATLDVLRNEFNSQGIIREFRVTSMLCVLILLGYTSGVSTIIFDSSIPVPCSLSSNSEGNSSQESVSTFQTFEFAMIITAFAVAFGLILFGYFVRLRRLFFGKDRLRLLRGLFKLEMHAFRHSEHNASRTITLQEKEAATKVKTIRQFQKLSIMISENNTWNLRLKKWLIAHTYAYEDSFLSSLPTITFSFTYGIAQVVVYRWVKAPKLSEQSSAWGFGQLVALLLLILPFLSASEAFYDYKNDVTNLSKVQHVNRSHNEPHVMAEHQQNRPTTDQLYSTYESDIKIYFPTQVLLQNLSTSDKQSLLNNYLALKMIENKIYSQPIWPIFTMELVISVVLGYLLNSADLVQNLIGSFLLVGSVVGLAVLRFVGTFCSFWVWGRLEFQESENLELQMMPVLHETAVNHIGLEAGF